MSLDKTCSLGSSMTHLNLLLWKPSSRSIRSNRSRSFFFNVQINASMNAQLITSNMYVFLFSSNEKTNLHYATIGLLWCAMHAVNIVSRCTKARRKNACRKKAHLIYGVHWILIVRWKFFTLEPSRENLN